MSKTVTDVRAKEKEAVLESLRGGAYLSKAAEAAGISSVTLWRWRQADAKFNTAVESALETRIGTVEDALYSKAVKGNVTAQIFFLCNRGNGRWRHVQHIQHGGKLEHEISDKRPEELTIDEILALGMDRAGVGRN